jgi:hypothetical protein
VRQRNADLLDICSSVRALRRRSRWTDVRLRRRCCEHARSGAPLALWDELGGLTPVRAVPPLEGVTHGLMLVIFLPKRQ